MSSESGELNYVQKINADTENVQIVLDSEKESELSLDILNYDTDVRISFPFEVRSSEGNVLAAHTWNPLYPSYIIPSDTDEGIYTIKAAAVSRSTGLFLSTDELKVEISGKLYGLKLIDNNSSSAEWKDVFRTDGVSKNLFAALYEDGTDKISFDRLYRYYYSSGLNDRFGNRTMSAEKYTLPIVDGDSPIPVAAGMLKSGYTWKFVIKTYGNLMAEGGSHIVIKPSFYYLGMPEKSSINGKSYQKLLGSSVREEANIYSNVTGNSLKREGQLIEAKQVSRNHGEVTWEFEYQLPDSWYCVPKSVDLDSYIEKRGGLTFKEEFWKEKGFVAVSFEIGAYSASGNLVMTYSNTEENVGKGMCDMWSMEGYRTSKTDCFSDTFLLREGDVILVRIPGSTKDSTGVPAIPTNSSEDKIVTYPQY